MVAADGEVPGAGVESVGQVDSGGRPHCAAGPRLVQGLLRSSFTSLLSFAVLSAMQGTTDV